MTWVLATAFGIFGSMIGDVRVCRLQGGQLVPYSTVGLRKVHVFSDRTVCGFAGELTRAWAALDSLNRYMRANGCDEPPLNEQLQGWVDHVARTDDALAKPVEHLTELIVLRTFLDPDVNIVLAGGVRIGLPHRDDTEFRLRPFLGVDHIGSGSAISAYQDAAQETNRSLSGFAGFEQAAPGQGVVGRIYAKGLSDVIAKSKEATVSPDVDVVVLSASGHWAASLRRTDPPLHVCPTVDEFVEHARAEDGNAALAVIA